MTVPSFRQRRSPLYYLSLGLGIAGIACVLLAIIGYHWLLAAPPPPPEATPPPAAPPDRAPLDEQLASLERSMQRRVSGSFWLDIRPEELAVLIAPGLRARGVRDAKLYFGEGVVIAQGRASVSGRELYVTLHVQPTVAQGQLRMQIVSGRMGRLPMPRGIREEIQRQLDAQRESLLPDPRHMTLDSVRVTPGMMIVEGRVGER